MKHGSKRVKPSCAFLGKFDSNFEIHRVVSSLTSHLLQAVRQPNIPHRHCILVVHPRVTHQHRKVHVHLLHEWPIVPHRSLLVFRNLLVTTLAPCPAIVQIDIPWAILSISHQRFRKTRMFFTTECASVPTTPTNQWYGRCVLSPNTAVARGVEADPPSTHYSTSQSYVSPIVERFRKILKPNCRNSWKLSELGFETRHTAVEVYKPTRQSWLTSFRQ